MSEDARYEELMRADAAAVLDDDLDEEFLSDQEMLARVIACGGETIVSVFPMRMQPDGEHPGRKVFPLAVELPSGGYLAVLFSFGFPSTDPVEDWKPRWRDVKGPMSIVELTDLGRSLA
jgi:hypothetical protein